MFIKNAKNPVNSPQIIPFTVENSKPQLSINTDDKENRLFYIEYYTMVKNRCLGILRNEEDAEDIAHAVFEKIQKLKQNGQFNIQYPKTYLSTMAKNMSINNKKKARRELIEIYDMATNVSLNRIKSKDEQEVWEASIIDNGYEQVEAEIVVKAILAEQDEITRKIYFYKYHDNMTLEQIGEVVKLGKSAVHKRIKNLEEQVKAVLGKVKK
jgi:RNA polymerase sigma-70 factor (ECF subfamily)